jgi:glyoxylase-like metal-dependent hydrolase (beta-lactamase superfamily II)
MEESGPSQQPREWRLGDWQPVAPDVYRLVAEPASVNIGLVVGAEGALLIDTGSSPAQGRQIRAAVAQITDRPLSAVVVTHDHFDHAYGLAGFDGVHTIGHESLAETLTDDQTAARARELGFEPGELALPQAQIGIADAVDLGGGRVAEITHLGIAHSSGDLVITITDTGIEGFPGVIFAGDLIESAGPPWFGSDSSVDQWSWAVERLANLAAANTIVVPGHGDPVDREFIRDQRDALDAVRMEMERLIAAGVSEQNALVEGNWPFPAEHIAAVVTPGYAELKAAAANPSDAGSRPTLPLA